MTLWAILTIMTSAAAVFLATPFLRRLDQRQEEGRDIEVYRDQLSEVEKEAAAGLIDGDQAERASTEIKRRLLAADRARGPSLARFSLGERNFAAVAIAGIVVLGSVALYAMNGSPELPSARAGASLQVGASSVDQLAAATTGSGSPGLPQSPSQNGSQPRLGTVDEMIGRLVDRLNRNPNDAEGWRMLGWSYFNTERFAQAATAYAKAIELNPQAADYHSSRGEALVRAADGLVTAEAKTEFEQAVRLETNEPRARFFLGLAKEQTGNKQAALDDWIAILNDTDSADAWVNDLKQRVAELGKETGVDVVKRLNRPDAASSGSLLGMMQRQEQAPATPNVAVPNVAPPIAAPAIAAPPISAPSRGPSAADVRNAESMQPADRMAMIQGMVDRLASRLSQSPRDVDGWIRLMRSRQVLGEADAAEETMRLALDVFKDAPQEQDRISAAARELGLIK
jgi:cytochrome c-type biogenesis protein CcmH